MTCVPKNASGDSIGTERTALSKRRARAEGDFAVGHKKEAGGRYRLYRARRGVGEGQRSFAGRNHGAQPRSGSLARKRGKISCVRGNYARVDLGDRQGGKP